MGHLAIIVGRHLDDYLKNGDKYEYYDYPDKKIIHNFCQQANKDLCPGLKVTADNDPTRKVLQGPLLTRGEAKTERAIAQIMTCFSDCMSVVITLDKRDFKYEIKQEIWIKNGAAKRTIRWEVAEYKNKGPSYYVRWFPATHRITGPAIFEEAWLIDMSPENVYQQVVRSHEHSGKCEFRIRGQWTPDFTMVRNEKEALAWAEENGYELWWVMERLAKGGAFKMSRRAQENVKLMAASL